MTLHAPQIILLAFMAAGFGLHLVNHGKPAPEYDAAAFVVAKSIVLALLYWGGFFG